MNISQYLAEFVGYHSLFIDGFNPLGIETVRNMPFISVTWFLRDLILCSLIAPLLMKFKWVGYILIILCAGTSLFHSAPTVVMAPFTVASFCIGLYLSRFDISSLKRFYQDSYTPYVFLLTVLSLLLGVINYFSFCQGHPECPEAQILYRYGIMSIQWPSLNIGLVGNLLGAMLLLSYGIIIERKFPIARRFSNYAPACFLGFVLHCPLMKLIPNALWASFPVTPLFLTFPIIAFI